MAGALSSVSCLGCAGSVVVVPLPCGRGVGRATGGERPTLEASCPPAPTYTGTRRERWVLWCLCSGCAEGGPRAYPRVATLEAAANAVLCAVSLSVGATHEGHFLGGWWEFGWNCGGGGARVCRGVGVAWCGGRVPRPATSTCDAKRPGALPLTQISLAGVQEARRLPWRGVAWYVCGAGRDCGWWVWLRDW